MIKKDLISKVLEKALSNGADFAEIFLEKTFNSSINMYDSITQRSIAGKDFGAGVRVFYGETAIYVYTNDMSEESLLKAASAVSQALVGGAQNRVIPLVKESVKSAHPVLIPTDSVPKEEKILYMRQIDHAARTYNSSITQVDITFLEKKQDILIANSLGLFTEDTRDYVRVFLNVIAGEGSEKQSCFDGPGALSGYEFIKSLDPHDLGERTAATAILMLHADYAPSGKFPVIIDNGFGGVIFHEACGHGLEATSVAKGASIFAGKMGQKVASEVVTAIDDGTIINKWGSINIDDEGTPAQKTTLIQNGVLKSYLVDKIGGVKMKMESTGSGRRQSYKFAPTSRMRNTYIAPGNDSLSEMIASIELGLYAKKMGGGSVLPGTGSFNFSVAEGHLIRNGKIAEPVRGATLIGNGAEVLHKISMVADNLEFAEGMCGSASGSIPTCVGQPAIKVDEIIVGGRK